MVDRPGQPWLVSLGLHVLVGTLVLVLVFPPGTPAPRVVRMHLLGGPAGPAAPAAASGRAWTPPAMAASRPTEVPAPSWQDPVPRPGAPAVPVSAPALLEELLGATQAEAVTDPAPAPQGVWSGSSGDGYVAPPLPPPRLAPPQGARWSLVLTVPGAGGLASSFEGMDSGHPELDQWLETYLRSVSFPPGLDGNDYRLRWELRLATGKPR